jgi:hypothetical protein
MSTQKQRIATIIALINSSAFNTISTINKIKAEFRQVIEVDSVTPPRRRNILKVLHSTRALDTTLKGFLDYYAIRNGEHSIGQYLVKLNNHPHTSLDKISRTEKDKYQLSIATKRNVHLHQADSYPANESEVNEIISEMQALMSRVVAL